MEMAPVRSTARKRLWWLVPRALTLVIVALWLAQWVQVLGWFAQGLTAPGVDYVFYVNAADHSLKTGQFYLPSQLAGPHTWVNGVDVLYPPTSLIFFVPFVVLPAVLWWAIPIGLTAWAIWRMRPAALSWPVLALCLLYPSTSLIYWNGNTAMWLVAAVALAGVYGWPSVFVLLKPTLIPFAVLGIWRRSWWIALAGLILISLPFGLLWLDYARVGLDLRGASGGLYSLYQVPTMLLPVTAWVAGEGGLARQWTTIKLPVIRLAQMARGSNR